MTELNLDWNDIQSQISGSADPEHPVQIIKNAFQNHQEPYDVIDKELDQLIRDLQTRFQERL